MLLSLMIRLVSDEGVVLFPNFLYEGVLVWSGLVSRDTKLFVFFFPSFVPFCIVEVRDSTERDDIA